MTRQLAVSVLDLVGVRAGESAGAAIGRAVHLAQHAERLGFHRFWLAEHHGMQGMACSATSVLMAHIAQQTSSIRIGSGGVMLPNHAPLVIAEQFGTLASIHPDRIDLGLGRAPGCHPLTAQALRRSIDAAEDFPEQVAEIQRYLGPKRPGRHVRALPGEDTHVPITLLGSSDFTARLAAQLGLPFAFGAHFSPQDLGLALETYRHNFTPSATLAEPYVMVGLPVVAADTAERARFLFTTPQQRFLALNRKDPVEIKPPVASMEGLWSESEKKAIDTQLAAALVGTPATIREGLQQLVDQYAVDEVLAVTDAFDVTDRLRSYELFREASKTVELRLTMSTAR